MTKKLCPKNSIEPPCAKKDKNGYLVTEKEALEKLYIETYTERLKTNEIREGFSELRIMKEYLFQINHKIAEERPSKDWKLEDLEKSLKTFKNNKSRDEHGHTYEIFNQTYPTIFRSSNISSIWKKKGDRSSQENDRGIFYVNKIRSISFIMIIMIQLIII